MADSTTRTRADFYRIEDLVQLATGGQIRVPEFQRNFRWGAKDVLNLFDSIHKGYPVGNLLLWRRSADAAQVQLGALSIDAPQMPEATWVVDGQQRITAIANAVSMDSYNSSELFRIDFDLDLKRFVINDGSVGDDLRIPLPVLFDLRKLLEWSQSRPDALGYVADANNAAVRLRDFSVPAYVVGDSDEDTLREIFDRTNNAGKKLRRAEVFHALFSDKDDSELTIEAIAEELESATNFGRIDDNTVLHAILVRRHTDFTRDLRKEFSPDRPNLDVSSDESREEAYEGGRDALRLAVEFLQLEVGVPHFTFLPYRYLLIGLARFFAHHPNPQQRNRDLLVRWFWRTALAPHLFKGSSTSMGIALTSRISPDDESGSVQELLALVPDDFRFSWPRGDQFRTNTAGTRVILCAMYELGPRRFSDGEVIGTSQLASSLGDADTAHDVIADIVPRYRIDDPTIATGAGGRFFLGDEDVALDEARDVLRRAQSLFSPNVDEVSMSHLVDETMSDMLVEGRYVDFVRLRQQRVSDVVDQFLRRRMGIGLPSNAPLTQFDLDDIDQ